MDASNCVGGGVKINGLLSGSSLLCGLLYVVSDSRSVLGFALPIRHDSEPRGLSSRERRGGSGYARCRHLFASDLRFAIKVISDTIA